MERLHQHTGQRTAPVVNFLTLFPQIGDSEPELLAKIQVAQLAGGNGGGLPLMALGGATPIYSVPGGVPLGFVATAYNPALPGFELVCMDLAGSRQAMPVAGSFSPLQPAVPVGAYVSGEILALSTVAVQCQPPVAAGFARCQARDGDLEFYFAPDDGIRHRVSSGGYVVLFMPDLLKVRFMAYGAAGTVHIHYYNAAQPD